MTELVYERWKDFALRMARTCFRWHRRPTSEWIIEQVELVFNCIDQDDRKSIVNWDHSDDGEICISDHVTEILGQYGPSERPENEDREMLAWEQYDQQWLGPIHCCVRAGLDMASAPSAGVLGFTAGDLRRMYPEGVPDWISHPGEKWSYWLTDQQNGVFAEMPDDMALVL